MMNRTHIPFALWIAAASSTLAQTWFSPIRDTSVAEEAPSAMHYDSSETLYTIGVPGFRAYALIQFDLTSLAGLDISGPATFGLFLEAQFPELSGSRSVSVWSVSQPWPGVGVTWNSFGATPGVQFGTDVPAIPEDTLLSDLLSEGPGYRTWSISGSLVQQWIDHPELNHGLLVGMQDTSANPYYWRSSEDPAGMAPYLEINTVPEAAPAVGLFGVSLGGVLHVLRRRSRQE